LSLPEYLRVSGREPEAIYPRQSWTALRRAAGFYVPPTGPSEDRLVKRAARFLHVDDQERLSVWKDVLAAPAPPVPEDLATREARLLLMLFFNIWPDGGGFSDHAAWMGSTLGQPGGAPVRSSKCWRLAAELVGHVPGAPRGDGLGAAVGALPVHEGGAAGRRGRATMEATAEQR